MPAAQRQSASTELHTRSGATIALDRKLGAGGEGAVYVVGGAPHIVAKIYHEFPAPERQAKLIAMTESGSEALRKFCAWPIETLHRRANGPVIGFTMPRISGHDPAHHLYSPAQRKHLFPKVDWAFLIQVARNSAAAVGAVHGHGHVVGDINENVVMVSPRALAVLIDCDSFQISHAGRDFLCEVGVPQYTPPELQGRPFRGVKRTPNHDAFGLAVLIFQFLLMGRHPFSGVHGGKGDLPLEKAIEQFRFAYGPNAGARGMKKPPGAFDLDLVTPRIASNFERAFTPPGALANGRPPAQEWVQALDELSAALRTCTVEPAHKYLGTLRACPWCEAEQTRNFVAFLARAARAAEALAGSAFDIDRAWARIAAVQSPGDASIPAFRARPAAARRPGSSGLAAQWASLKRVLGLFLILIAFLSLSPALVWLAIPGFILLFSQPRSRNERSLRYTALQRAQHEWETLARQWQEQATDDRFVSRYRELAEARDALKNLEQSRKTEIDRLHQTLRERQLERYLDRFYVRDSPVTGMNPMLAAALASFGIETAADVRAAAIPLLFTVGPLTANELVVWAQRLEQRFTFDPRQGVDPTDVAILDRRFKVLRQQLERKLTAGPEELERERQAALAVRSALLPRLEAAAAAYAQARADYAAI